MPSSTARFPILLLAAAATGCTSIDGYTVSCDVSLPTDAGTVHAWCSEDYGVPEDFVPFLEADCESSPSGRPAPTRCPPPLES
jgi:hypothetical protein